MGPHKVLFDDNCCICCLSGLLIWPIVWELQILMVPLKLTISWYLSRLNKCFCQTKINQINSYYSLVKHNFNPQIDVIQTETFPLQFSYADSGSVNLFMVKYLVWTHYYIHRYPAIAVVCVVTYNSMAEALTVNLTVGEKTSYTFQMRPCT